DLFDRAVLSIIRLLSVPVALLSSDPPPPGPVAQSPFRDTSRAKRRKASASSGRKTGRPPVLPVQAMADPSLPPQHPPGPVAGRFAILPDGLSVDNDHQYTIADTVDILVVRPVDHRPGIEERQVGPGSGPDHAAVLQSERLRCQRGHPPHRLFQREKAE